MFKHKQKISNVQAHKQKTSFNLKEFKKDWNRTLDILSEVFTKYN
jgi:hypothetical protein